MIYCISHVESEKVIYLVSVGLKNGLKSDNSSKSESYPEIRLFRRDFR